MADRRRDCSSRCSATPLQLQPNKIAFSRAVNVLRNRLVARRPDKTLVIDISVWQAARVANDIANIYLEQRIVAKTAAAKHTNTALVARLAELRERVSAKSASRRELQGAA